jgi:phosphoglycolate phosphatase
MTDRLVLFDIDGTILLTGGAGYRAMARAAVEVFGRDLPWHDIDSAGSLDPLILNEALQREGVQATRAEREAFKEHYTRFFPAELKRHPLRVMPGVLDIITSLSESTSHVVGVLTGNYEPTARLKVEAAGIAWSHFGVGAFGDEAATRAGLVPIALSRYKKLYGAEIAPDRVVIVGDTPKDVACAHASNCLAFGVGTGKFTTEALLEAGADAVSPHLKDPSPLLEFLRSPRSVEPRSRF